MTSPATSALLVDAAAKRNLRVRLLSATPDFLALTKPEVNFLILIATFTGFWLGIPADDHSFPVARMLNTLAGTLLVACGTAALNQYMEHRFDARMRRTWRRPVAGGRMRPVTAVWFGVSLSAAGAGYLFFAVNALATALAVFTLATYLFVYTPLKRITPLCTLAGALPGAMPPLIGWAAASGSLDNGKAWILYALLYLWQFPHFMAIAWMYREDYARAGYCVLPGTNEERFLVLQTLGPSVVIFLLSLAAAACMPGGHLTVILGLGFLYYSVRLAVLRSRVAARQLLKASIVYLPLEFLVLALAWR